MRALLLSLLLLLPLAGPAHAAGPADPSARPPSPLGRRAPAWEALFPRREGWTGGDGVYSLGLGAGTVLWFFGDTFLARVEDGARIGGTLVNNSVGVQRGLDPDRAEVELLWDCGEGGEPRAFFRPPEEGHWYWPLDAARIRGRLYLFQALITSTGESSAFGFRRAGTRLIEVLDPSVPPARWETRVHDIPHGGPVPGGEVYFGAAVLEHLGWLYVYGYRDRRGEAPVRELVVARVPRRAVTDLASWRFHTAGGWSRDWRQAAPLAAPAATELTVDRLPGGRFALVLSPLGISPELVLRTAPTPLGPFSEPLVLFRCPDMDREPEVFCYAGKAHPEASPPGELLASYVVNARDFWRMAGDAEMYVPRFVRTELERLDPPAARAASAPARPPGPRRARGR